MDGAGNVDYLAGVEVIGFEGLPTELRQISLTPHRYAVFAHAGHISLIGRTWMEIFDAWLPRSGYEMAAAPSFECYGEAFDPDVGMDNVAIWIPIEA